MRARAVALLVLVLALALRPAAADDPAPPAGADRDLEQNLRWILARERAPARAPARIGVYADAGAWHVGARALVAALESADAPCRVLDRTAVTAAGLAGLDALVIPGGWAPSIAAALGPDGLAAIRTFVEQGGRYVGVCAGAYLAAREVRWEGQDYPYALALFPGVAEGPVLAPWPRRVTARVQWTDAGRARGLGPDDGVGLYLGGPRLVLDRAEPASESGPRRSAGEHDPAIAAGEAVEVLARYPDGSAAVTATRRGRGEVVLIGVHLERPPIDERGASDDDAPPPPGAGALLRRLALGAPP